MTTHADKASALAQANSDAFLLRFTAVMSFPKGRMKHEFSVGLFDSSDQARRWFDELKKELKGKVIEIDAWDIRKGIPRNEIRRFPIATITQKPTVNQVKRQPCGPKTRDAKGPGFWMCVPEGCITEFVKTMRSTALNRFDNNI